MPRHFELRVPILLDQHVLVCHDEPLLVSIARKDSRVVHCKVALLRLVNKGLRYNTRFGVGASRFSSVDMPMQVSSLHKVANQWDHVDDLEHMRGRQCWAVLGLESFLNMSADCKASHGSNDVK